VENFIEHKTVLKKITPQWVVARQSFRVIRLLDEEAVSIIILSNSSLQQFLMKTEFVLNI
jgi:hypothetical protein